MRTREMIATHPDVAGSVNEALVRLIDEAFACAQACTSCADACLAEEMVADLRQCIRLNLDCADVCAAIATVTTRRTGSNEEVIRGCCRPASWPVACAARNASGTPRSTSTDGSAPKLASGARPPARRRAGAWPDSAGAMRCSSPDGPLALEIGQ